jgi:hypothetical protein
VGRNLDAERNRDRMDAIAWAIIDAHVPPVRPLGYKSSRPANFAELSKAVEAFRSDYPEDLDPLPGTWPAFEHAWSNFLHEFFYWRLADFFAVPPPETLGLERGALLAGAAEYLCRRYDLDLPDWIDDPQYVLPEIYDFWGDITPEVRAMRFRRVQRSSPEFLKRNVVFEARNLIVL